MVCIRSTLVTWAVCSWNTTDFQWYSLRKYSLRIWTEIFVLVHLQLDNLLSFLNKVGSFCIFVTLWLVYYRMFSGLLLLLLLHRIFNLHQSEHFCFQFAASLDVGIGILNNHIAALDYVFGKYWLEIWLTLCVLELRGGGKWTWTSHYQVMLISRCL